jgi:hypothetical protein
MEQMTDDKAQHKLMVTPPQMLNAKLVPGI